MTYLIKRNALAPVTLAAAGINSATLNYRANGLDTLTFSIAVASFYATPLAFSHADTIAIIQRPANHPASPDRCVFVGTIERTPPQATAGAEQTHAYEVYGPAYDLQLCEYSQQWTYRTSAGVSTKSLEPTVCLGESNNGARLTTGGQITEVINHAIARGVKIQLGTIATGVTAPFDERQNIKCWDAIISMLRYTPDYVLHFDYDTSLAGTYAPTAHLTPPASMPVKALAVTSLFHAEIDPRNDIRVPGIAITFNYTGNIDGTTTRTRATQLAGTPSHPRAVHLAYDLEGTNITYLKQEVEVDAYPTDWLTPAGKTYLENQIPWLASLSEYTLEAVTRSGTKDYPARLTSGSIASWMQKGQESETITAEIIYTQKDSSSGIVEKATKKVSFTALSTNAKSTTYVQQSSFLGPEPVPPDLATNLYASWNRLHCDGRVTYIAQSCPADILPGHALNITGGLPSWANMKAIVQDASLDLIAGSTTLTTGTCERLEADNLMSIFRAARGRSFCYRRQSRDAPDSSSGDIPGTGTTATSNTADGAPAEQIHRLRVLDKDPSDITHIIDLFPGSTAFATPADKTATTIAPRERLTPYLDAQGKIQAKLVQVLCSDTYGDPIPLGGARPADPTSAVTKGTKTEADNSGSTAYDPLNPGTGEDGASIWLSLGSYYDHTATAPVLKEYRVKLTFPNAICPTISAAESITIDTPEKES